MIPLSVPNLSGNEWQYIKTCIDTEWVSSVGSFVDRFEREIAEYTGARHAISTVNGSAALHTSLVLLDVQPGDWVILPNITFAATANTVRYQGADPLLVDVREDTWQLDIDLLADLLKHETQRTAAGLIHRASGRRIAAVVPVHVLGNMVDMDALLALTAAFGLPVIEDAAEALGSYYGQKHAGTLGKLSALSFNGNKIMTTGGGGMLLTNDDALAQRARHITRQAKVDPVEYDHDMVGYNYRLVNVLAAMGVAQLEQMDAFLGRKKEIADKYTAAFQDHPAISFQQTTPHTRPNHWLFTVRCERSRELLRFLADRQIQARPLWRPMNQLPMFREVVYKTERDVSRTLNEQCLSIPCSTNLTDEQQHTVINAIKDFYK